jgi:exopolyphosphatase / guanosine-5'-triphosphate,3'-diphosphate pyrophosphatase
VSNEEKGDNPTKGVIAAFDIGSNTIKMTVARQDGENHLKEFLWRSETVRLGAGIDQTGRLADDRIEAAADTIDRFAREARAHGATRLIGVATEATRIADNGQAFLDRIRIESGIELTTITGDHEADLTFRGLAATTNLDGRLLVADIGGASTELIAAENERIEFSQSLPLGSGRLTDRHVKSDPPTGSELSACHDEAVQQLRVMGQDMGTRERLIAVGGTGEYLMPLIPHNDGATAKDVDEVLAFFETVTAEELASRLSIPIARARVLPAGVAIVRALADLTNPSAIEGAMSGIRTGLLLAAFAGEI